MKPEICHLTSVHNRYDNRIFYKMCISLARNGYAVSLVVADGKGDEENSGVAILDAGRSSSRFSRIFAGTIRVLRTGLKTRADIYHFHDPELIFAGLWLRLTGKKVVYDIHEDYTTSIAQKTYLPKIFRVPMAYAFGWFERLAASAFAKVIAEKYYAERFKEATPLLNYPLLESCAAESRPDLPLELDGHYAWYLYTGNVTKDRGALTHLNLLLADQLSAIAFIGHCSEALYEEMMRFLRTHRIEPERIAVVGRGRYIPHAQINWYTHHHAWRAGLALFPKTEHYHKKELTKFFEYMHAGLPILATDFDAWKELIEEQGCGLCTDPESIEAIRKALERLDTLRTGDGLTRCRARVVDTLNWQHEASKLFQLYARLMGAGDA